MNESKSELPENRQTFPNDDSKKTKEKNPLSVIWVAATILLCVAFTVVSVPQVFAQGRQENQNQANRQFISFIQTVFDFVQRNFVEEVDPRTLYEGAMNGLFNSLDDPYSSFLGEKEMSDLTDTTRGSFGGIGVNIIKPGDFVEVVSPIEGTPGWRAGLNPGDLIIQINQTSSADLTLDEVLNNLRGTPGSQVNLIIRRGTLDFPVTITRAVIEVPTARSAMIGEVGYLRLLTFTPNTVDRAREAIEEFKSKNYRGMILDLRNNFGGVLQGAVGVSDLFLDGGVVVSTRSRIPSENHVFTARSAAFVSENIPVVVLINRGSASASEIVAGALKDRGRAFLVGETTFGKGSVQQVFPLDRQSGFKLTIARYYTPSGVNIDKVGIPPDREVSLPEITESDAERINRLLSERRIPIFLEANPQASVDAIQRFARGLQEEFQLDLMLVRRLIRNEQNRTLRTPPVYDMDYDIQLQEAIRIIRSGEFNSLMRAAKTLKSLQEEAEGADVFPIAS